MVSTDPAASQVVPFGGAAIGQLTGKIHPTLAERRNALTHGDPFDGLSTGGLLELVIDLIRYAYRRCVAEAESFPEEAQAAMLNNMETGHGEL
jgi:hypothetical protein